MKISMHRVLRHGGWLPLLCASVSVLVAIPVSAAELQVLHGHLPVAVTQLTPVGSLPADQRLNLAIGLPLRNPEALTNLLHDLYDPASPSYRRFLTPEQFARSFGPSEADYQAVIAFAAAHGLEVTATHPNRAVLSVRGGVADIERALHLKLRRYQHPTEGRTFYSADAEPSLDLAVPVLHISGLSDYSLPHPMMIKKPLNLSAKLRPNIGSGPGGTYMGNDFRAAYVPGTTLTGAGQSVGLLQFDGYNPSDIAQYAATAGLAQVPLQNVYIDGATGAPGFGNGEVCLDIESVMSMAPGVSNIIVYMAPNPSPWVDILSRMADDNLSRQLSCSWGGGPPDPAGDQIFLQMAAQGQSFFNACGDSDAFTGAIPFPAESPYIMEVGGTTLTTTGPGGAWLSETVWNWGGGIGTCGGISPTYAIPTWQQGINMTTNQGSATMRNIPDVALTADNVFVVADNGQEENVGGTSAATPLWAGFPALINQQAAAASTPPVGFLNPALYAIGKGAAFPTCFHDIMTGDNTWAGSPDRYFAVPGYDLCTGWGTPMGTNLINALASPVTKPSLIVVSNYVFGGNGNGIIDFDECNNLNVTLANVGNAMATGVSATLSTTTPEVAIGQATSTYPNIPIGGSATNQTAFKISTSPAFVCGTPIQFSLLLQCDQAVTIFQFSLPTGLPGSPFRFDNSTSVPIPSPGTTNSTILVSNVTFAVNRVTVSVYVPESFDYYLKLELIAPDGSSNVLSANNGLFGQNYGIACSPDPQRTTFDDNAATAIATGVAPFVGSFKPDQPLSVYIGKSGTNVNGAWQLRATDSGFFDIGAIQCWSLFITPTLCVDGGGECPGADLALGMTALPNPVIAGNNLTYSIAVTNNGPGTATNTTATLLVPAGVLFVSASSSQGTYAEGAGAVTFNLGRIGPRGTATMTVVALPTVAGTIYSSASVSSEQPDFSPLNNSVILPTRVNPATADLAVTMAAAPSPALIGGTLTYSVTVTNYGPSSATGITVTNAFPAGLTLHSATGSRGTFTTVGNVVFWNLSGLTSGAGAAATITATPTVQGTLTATTTVAGGQFDPITANNTASVATVIGPASDLALGLVGNPNPVVTGSNITYAISVTNFGPSDATSVTVNDALPASVTVLATTPTQGSISISNSTLLWNLGTVPGGAKATLTIVAATTTNGTLSATATVIGAQADPNPANNSATVMTVATAPFTSIVAAGATLTYESGPTNGAIDVGETVTVSLRLANAGNSSTRNLVATLLATNGVTPVAPNNPQSYGILFPSGFPVGRPFSFTAGGTNGGTISPTLQLQDGTNTYPPVSFTFTLPNTHVFANTNVITIPDPAAPNPPYPPASGPASPYPAVVTVSNLTGVLGKVTVTLSNLTHSYTHDINVLLVAPGGAKTLLMSHAGSGAAGINLTLDDAAAQPLPDAGTLISGTWQPAAYSPAPGLGGFPTNAPAGPYPTALSVFNGVNPNGGWALYVFDDSGGDFGAISNGWSLALTMLTPVNQLADLGLSAVAAPNPVVAGGTLTYTFTVTNNGPNTATSVAFTNVLPAGVTLLSAAASQGAVTTNATGVVANLGNLGVGTNATLTELVIPTAAVIPQGSNTTLLTNTANISANEADVNPGNSSVAVASTVNRPVASVTLAQSVAPDPVYVGYYLTNTVAITNLGPGAALGVTLTQPLPPGAGFIANNSSSTVGTFTVANGSVICALGDLASNATALVSIVLTNSLSGLMTNTVNLSMGSYDPASNTHTSTYVATVNPVAPRIISAGAVLTYESGPVNGAIDAGESVTVSLSLANIGAQNTVNLKAALLATNGITAPTGPQSYGALVYGGPSASRSFGFKAPAVLGGALVATLQLQDERPGVTNNLGTVAFVFGSPGATNIFNSAAIIIPDHGVAAPYPSTINVSGLTGRVSKVTLGLNGLTHSFPHDVNVLLVSPAGTNVLVMSHTGGGYPVTNLNLTFDDTAAGALPNSTLITSGTYKPSSYQGPVALPGTAPSKSYQYALSGMNWNDPNGAWSLYVFDDTVGDAGSIVSGWSLSLSTVVTVGPVNDLAVGLVVPAAVDVGGTLTNTITLTNSGPDSATGVVLTNLLPAGASFVSASLSQGSVTSAGGGRVTCNLGSLAAGSAAQVIILTTPSTAGSLVNSVNVTANEEDLAPANNSAQGTTTAYGPATLSGAFAGSHFRLTVTARPNYVYDIQGSTNLASWVTLGTTNNTTGTFNFTDTTTPAPRQRYYRTLRH